MVVNDTFLNTQFNWQGTLVERRSVMTENVNTADRDGHTPLIIAAREGKDEAVRDLLHRGADLEARSNKGKTALHYAAANGHAEVIKILLQQGADVDARDRDGHTPLMLAANYGCNECVANLLDFNADIQAKTMSGNNALVYAETNCHPDTLELLRKAQRTKQAV